MNNVSLQNIAAVIVIYYPDGDFETRLYLVLPQVKKVVVIDNTASSSTQNLLIRLQNRGCHVIKNEINRGAAGALNQGISWAEEQGYTWVLTLDQDTYIHDGLINLYINALKTNLAGINIGVINTVYRDLNTGKLGITFGDKKKAWTDVPALITSGSFFAIATYKKVGPFREDFFLDWADHDFCLRARTQGLRNYIYKIPFLDHTLGNKTEHKLLFKKLTVPTNNHSPFRCYLISRNLTILLKKNYIREFRWSLFLTFYLITKFILVGCFENNKFSKTQNLFKGLLDGLFNKSSKEMILKYQESLQESPE